MPTKQRIAKVERALSLKQPDLRVVLEEVRNTHNASAVVRTCDSAGILYVDVIYSDPSPFPINEAISTRAEKWLEFINHHSTPDCLGDLKRKGFKIASTLIDDAAVPFTDIDYTQPMAIVFGNESEGVSEEARGLSDYIIRIPMKGMAQSLNLSVSVGIILYEAMKQRLKKSFFEKRRLNDEEYERLRRKWLGLS